MEKNEAVISRDEGPWHAIAVVEVKGEGYEAHLEAEDTMADALRQYLLFGSSHHCLDHGDSSRCPI